MARNPRPALLSLGVALALGACATATPYQPASRGEGGYTDQRIEANRYRVSFRGNSVTSRETVEIYLLYRAAELTLARGFDHFVMAARDTDKRSRTYVDRPFTSGPYGYWGPSWRYWGPGFGWRSWDPYWGDPFWHDSIDVRTVDRYEATAEIVMYKGLKPANDPRAFDARAVIANLGPNVRLPT